MSSPFDAILAKAKDSQLHVKLGDKVLKNNEHVPKAETHSTPSLSLTGGAQGTYIAIGLDIDAPFPSFNTLSPILHYLQTGLKPSGMTDSSNNAKLEAADAPIASYIGASPPPFSGPHRYVFALYAQPDGFEYAQHKTASGDVGYVGRTKWNLDEFVKKAGLGEVVAAAVFLSN